MNVQQTYSNWMGFCDDDLDQQPDESTVSISTNTSTYFVKFITHNEWVGINSISIVLDEENFAALELDKLPEGFVDRIKFEIEKLLAKNEREAQAEAKENALNAHYGV